MRIFLISGSIILCCLVSSCAPSGKIANSGDEKAFRLEQSAEDSVGYDLIIFDPGFQPWFDMNRKPVWYHSKEYLETWNQQYVFAWNEKVRNSFFQFLNPGNPFELEIDYRPGVDYGLDLNYKLYHYFLFIEDTWGRILAINRR